MLQLFQCFVVSPQAAMTILSLPRMLLLTFQVISAELHGPQLLVGSGQLGDRGDILLFQEVLHMVPTILTWIEVRALGRPVCHLESYQPGKP